jgi:WD40 repeat protein
LRVLRGHRDYVNAIAFHPEADGDQLVSGSDDHTIALWNCTSGQHQHTVTFDSPVMSVIWHPEELSKLMVSLC